MLQTVFAQISGNIMEANENSPLEYATAALFYEKDNLDVRKENGIYITPYSIIEKCYEGEKLDGLDILEPSFGSGQFREILCDPH